MKKCPECGLDLPDEVLYCLYCGTRTNISNQVKRTRIVLFLFPIFILLSCLATVYDLGSSDFLEAGFTIAGIACCLYFLGALFLGILKLFFNIKTAPSSFFTASFSSLIIAITTIFAGFSIENLYLKNYFVKLGPIANLKKHFILLLTIYLVLQILESIAISLKDKYTITSSSEDKNNSRSSIITKLYIIIPISFILLTSVAFFFTSHPDKISFLCENLLAISSKDKANQYLDYGLQHYPRDAKLCFLKANILTSSDSFSTEHNSKTESEALKLAQIASDEKPDSPLYKYYLSVQFDINKNSEKAIMYADEAAVLAKDDIFLWQNLGDINQKYSRFTGSISAYRKALTLDPDNPTVLNNLSYTLLTCNKDLLIALELAEKSVKNSPNSVYNRDTLAWAYYKNNQFTNALESINLLYKNRKSISPEIDFHYVAILDSMGLIKNPIEDYDKMLVKPEVATNKNLVLEIVEAKKIAENKLKEKQNGKLEK